MKALALALFSLVLPLAAWGAPAAGLPDFTALVKKQGPAVVNVITSSGAPEAGAGAGGPGAPGISPDDPFFEFFRRFMPELPEGMPPPGQGRGIGSGFIISKDGYILTNAHVVANADEVTVRLADAKREYKAKVIGVDERTDVGLIKVDAKDLPVATLGSSKNLEAGQWVAAIGSPFGFDNTVTAGIVSATQRALPAETYVPFIQTDVAVNPGNSGGPLLNLAGEVVGINSMIYSQTGGYMGVSFAIPIEVAMDIAKQLRETGKVTRGRLGIGIQGLTKELAASFGLDTAKGVVVTNVEPGSPAEEAGLQVGDVIVSYNGTALDDANNLPRLVGQTKPGEQAKIEILRQGKPRTLTAQVGEMPAARTAQAPGAQGRPGGTQDDRLGLTVRELEPAEREKAGGAFGVVVVDAGQGPAARSGIRPGDVILAVNQQRFKSIEEFRKLIAGHEKGSQVALLVRRGEGAIYVPIPVG
jgi:serine protease Do